MNFNKKFEINVFVYHVKIDAKWNESKYFSRKLLKFILFLNRLLTSIETRYWFIKFELVDIIWIFKKIRHMIESSSIFIIIYIDHDIALKIVKQITFIISSINKLNLRLIKIFNYVQRFNLKIRYKFEIQHVIFDVFSRFANLNIEIQLQNYENEFDVFFIVILIEMNENFRFRILKNYQKKFSWKKIVDLLNKKNNFCFKNKVFFSFFRKSKFIFRSNNFVIDVHVFVSRKLCIFRFFVDEIFNTIHDAINKHNNFHKCYKRLIFSYFIRNLFFQLRVYLRYCSNC